jgi:hypothetical protein
LKTYAQSSPRTHFVDIVRRFDEVGRPGLFVDKCCHLTDAGAAVEAQAIYDEISGNGDLM